MLRTLAPDLGSSPSVQLRDSILALQQRIAVLDDDLSIERLKQAILDSKLFSAD